jgi:chromosome segregation and condensation protein ScpB
MPDDARTVAVHIPAALADQLGGPGPGLDRRALEALAVAAYQAGELTRFELREILGIETRHALDGFLRARGVNDGMTLAEWGREQETLDRLGL